MKRLLLVLFLLAIVIAGCQTTVGKALAEAISRRAFTAQLVFNRQASAYSRKFHDFRLLGTRDTPDGKVAAVYTFREPANGSQPDAHVNGFLAAEQVDLLQWEIVQDYNSNSWSGAKSSGLIDYTFYQGDYSAIFGPVYQTQIESVDVLFADGYWYRDPVRGEFFLVSSPGGEDVCAIRALNKEGQILYERKFTEREYGEYSDGCS